MSIRRLGSADEVYLETFLSAHIETSMFMLSNARAVGLDYHDARYHGEYFASFAGPTRMDGILAHYWNGIILMQAPARPVLDALIGETRGAMSRPVAGIIGPCEQAEAVILGLGLADADYATNRDEALYALDLSRLVLPARLDAGCYRLAQPGEVDRSVLRRWFRAYEIEALGAVEDPALDRRVEERIDQTLAGDDLWVLMVRQKPASLCGFNAKLSDLVQVGPVWTPPDLRGLGYARLLVALTLLQARKQGVKKAILFTDNPAAASAYEAIGFDCIGSYRLALLRQPLTLPLE